MSDDELLSNLKRISAASQKRGHASFDAVPPDDAERGEPPGYWREIRERSWVQEFAISLAAETGEEISEIESNPDDPPDCFAQINGKRIGIELTELVKPEILQRIALDRDGIRPYHPSEKFEDEEWLVTDFTDALEKLIARKDRKARESTFVIDFLLIHTDEPDLTPEKLQDYVGGARFVADSISSIYLVRTYWPGNVHDRWPIYRLK